MCVFHVFRGYRPAKTTIIIGVWGRGRQRRRDEISVFFRGAENGPGRASNGRFGPPFWRFKGGDTQRVKSSGIKAGGVIFFCVFQGCRKWPREGLKRAFWDTCLEVQGENTQRVEMEPSGWGAMCVFHVFGGYRPAQTIINIGFAEQPKNSFAYKTPAEPPNF